MNQFNFLEISAAVPEIFLASSILLILLVGVFTHKEYASRSVAGLSIATLIITFFLMLPTWGREAATFFYTVAPGSKEPMFIVDSFTFYIKGLILLISTLTILLAYEPLKRLKANKFEFYILILLATLGMMVATSSVHLIMLYMGLELMSFPLYILAAFKRDSAYSAEAGLKYFIMGSLASGVLLFSMSYLYGLSGGLAYTDVVQLLSGIENVHTSLPAVVSIVLFITAIGFKLSAVPFHMWTPDVYQGAPTPVTTFMAAAPKVAAFAVLLKILFIAFIPAESVWLQVIIALSILTMGVGSYMAIVQNNIKRLLAYSSIGNVGFMLTGLVAGVEGVQGILVYLTVYSITVLGSFGVLMTLRRKEVYLERLEDIAGLWKLAPQPAFMLLVLLFSVAGVPPLAGFFAKFYVFNAVVGAGYTWLAILGVLFSVISAYYVLRLIRTMFFDEPQQGAQALALRVPNIMHYTLVLSVVFTIVFIFALHPVGALTYNAAKALVQ